MKLFLYRTFTWTTIGVTACATSFLAGAVTMSVVLEKDKKKEPEETPAS